MSESKKVDTVVKQPKRFDRSVNWLLAMLIWKVIAYILGIPAINIIDMIFIAAMLPWKWGIWIVILFYIGGIATGAWLNLNGIIVLATVIAIYRDKLNLIKYFKHF